MAKRVVVAGCRTYENYNEAKVFIDQCIKEFDIKEEIIFLSGRCRGADMLGERYARENGIKTELYPAEWGKYGNAAGPIRNRKMAERADFVICFWDGQSKGTASLINYIKKLQKPILIKHTN